MKAPLSYVPALPAALGMVVGIILYHYGLGIFSAILSLVIFLTLYLTGRHYPSFFFLMTCAGIISVFVSDSASLPTSAIDGNIHNIRARVMSLTPHSASSQYIVSIKNVDGHKIDPVKCAVTVFSPISHIEEGSLIDIECTIDTISNTTDIPEAYNFSAHLLSDGIHYTASVMPEAIKIASPPGKFDSFVNAFRDKVFNAIVDSPINGDTAAFMIGIILGDRQFIDNDRITSYRSLGIAHVLALSGLHVGILASLLSLLFWPIRILRHGRLLRSLVLIACIWFYAILCGMSPSIMRAAIMITVCLIASLIQRGYYVANSLLLSVVVILAVSPMSLFTAGFQLSVCAVASILVFTPIVPLRWKRRPWLYFLANMIVVPIAAMLGTGIVSSYYFHTFPFLFLPANILTGLLFPWILTSGVILAMFTSLGIDFSILGKAVDGMYDILDVSVNWLAGMPIIQAKGLYFSAWSILPYALAIVLLAIALRRRSRVYLTYALTLMALSFVSIDLYRPSLPKAEMYITRQGGTNIVMRCEHSAALLTTCSESLRDATVANCERYMQAYLRSRNCPDTFVIANNGIDIAPFRYKYPYLVAGETIICIVDSDSLPIARNIKVDYALICGDFSGSVNKVVENINPCAIMLAADIYPSRRERMMRECPDSIAVHDLRTSPFSIIW